MLVAAHARLYSIVTKPDTADVSAIDAWRQTASDILSLEEDRPDSSELAQLYNRFLDQEIHIATEFGASLAADITRNEQAPLLVLGLANSGLAAAEGVRRGLEQTGRTVDYLSIAVDRRTPFLPSPELLEKLQQAGGLIVADDTLCYGSTLKRLFQSLGENLPAIPIHVYSTILFDIRNSRQSNSPVSSLQELNLPIQLHAGVKIIDDYMAGLKDPIASISHKKATLLGEGEAAEQLHSRWISKPYADKQILTLVDGEIQRRINGQAPSPDSVRPY